MLLICVNHVLFYLGKSSIIYLHTFGKKHSPITSRINLSLFVCKSNDSDNPHKINNSNILRHLGLSYKPFYYRLPGCTLFYEDIAPLHIVIVGEA